MSSVKGEIIEAMWQILVANLADYTDRQLDDLTKSTMIYMVNDVELKSLTYGTINMTKGSNAIAITSPNRNKPQLQNMMGYILRIDNECISYRHEKPGFDIYNLVYLGTLDDLSNHRAIPINNGLKNMYDIDFILADPDCIDKAIKHTVKMVNTLYKNIDNNLKNN